MINYEDFRVGITWIIDIILQPNFQLHTHTHTQFLFCRTIHFMESCHVHSYTQLGRICDILSQLHASENISMEKRGKNKSIFSTLYEEATLLTVNTSILFSPCVYCRTRGNIYSTQIVFTAIYSVFIGTRLLSMLVTTSSLQKY